ncbi:helix-turn-helix transcriptional regulator, partial [Cereibacter changlensis]
DAARVARFLDRVRSTARNRMSVADHAAALGLSPRHLARLCRDHAGQSPKALIEAELMREACRSLVYTRMPVQRIAWQLGYDDPAYFARRFRAHTGQTASDYRAAFDGGEGEA